MKKEKDCLVISKYTEKSKEIITELNKFFKENNQDVIVKDDVLDRPISIVFAGQYSAGKSTILKLLTGRKDIAIGDGITTMETHNYKWNGFDVIDTPGIHTELRPDHDKISYEAISKADMLVYVVTCQLFDNHIGQKFRTLLNEKSKGNEMILVVNKMAEEGNTKEIQEEKLKDLQKVTKPYTPKQLRTVFIDAKSYIKSLENNKNQEVLYKRSNYATFIDTLNSFIKEKQIPAHLTTPLYQIIETLNDVIIKNQNKLKDEDINRLEEQYKQERYTLSSSKWNIKNKINGIISECVSNIQEIGRKTAEDLEECKKKEEAESLIQNAYDEVNNKYIDYVNKIIKSFEDEIEKCSKNFDELYNKDWVKDLNCNITKRYEQGDTLISKLLSMKNLNSANKGLRTASQKIIEQTISKEAISNGLKGLRAFSGSSAQESVKTIGHFLGHKFKPWESLKWVDKIGKAAKFLGVFAIALDVFLKIKGDRDNAKLEQQMKDNRNEVRARFNDVAEKIKQTFNTELENFIMEFYDKPIEEKDNQIEEIGKQRTDKSDICIKLETFRTECKNLIEDIHNEFKKEKLVSE